MGLGPRTPVLVGVGQINQRDESPDVEPIDLMAAAAAEAADPRVLGALDSIRVVNLLSWRYRDPGLLLKQRIGARDASTQYTGIGGNTPQSLVNQACRDISAGRADAVLLAGAEAWRCCRPRRVRSTTMWGFSCALVFSTPQDDTLYSPRMCQHKRA